MNDITLFDETAQRFAVSIDDTISRGAYDRGRMIGGLATNVLEPGARVLDYGCGPGRLTAILAGKGFIVHGAEPSLAMLNEARTYATRCGHSEIKFDQITADWLQRTTDGYDAVLCSSVIEYVKDVDGFLNQIRNLLVPGGILLLTFANGRSLWRQYAKLRFGHKQPHFNIQLNVWNWSECERVLDRCGFTVLSKPRYFESICDYLPHANGLSRLRFMGALGLVGARKRE